MKKNRVWIQKRLRVYIQNVPVCTGTTRTCVSTCARGAGIHGDVLDGHTEGRKGVNVSSAYQNLPTNGYHVLQRFTKETLRSFPFSSLRVDREQHVPDSSNHSLSLIKLFSFSNLEGNFRGIFSFISTSSFSSCLFFSLASSLSSLLFHFLFHLLSSLDLLFSCLSSSLSSLLFSCLVSLLFHLFLPSCLVLSLFLCLSFSLCLSLSLCLLSLYLSLSVFSLCLSLSLSVSLCLHLSPCDVVVVVVVVVCCCWCCILCCGVAR